MNPTASDVANMMRLTSRTTNTANELSQIGQHPQSQKTVVGIVVLVILMLHMFRVMVIVSHHDSRMCDLLPTVVILFGCVLYTRDSLGGRYGTGLIKLTVCMVIAHLVFPNIWDTPETRWAEYHVRESHPQNTNTNQ
jgi:hypothetical protein